MSRCRVLLVDDHPVFRFGLRRVVESVPQFECAGEAADAPTARRLLAEVVVDLVTVDLRLARGSGLDLIAAIRAQYPHVRMLVLSMTDPVIFAPRAILAGAHGFVSKGASAEEIISSLRAVARGEQVLPSGVEARIVAPVAGTSREDLARLSNRELEVFAWLGRGASTAAIAAALGVSPKTIETHRASVARKLGLRGTASLVRAAVASLGDETSGMH